MDWGMICRSCGRDWPIHVSICGWCGSKQLLGPVSLTKRFEAVRSDGSRATVYIRYKPAFVPFNELPAAANRGKGPNE